MTTVILHEGNVGDDVRTLQSMLQSQGFYTDIIDGQFGPITERALVKFQSSHLGPDGKYLEVDGVCGTETWWALENPQHESKCVSTVLSHNEVSKIDPIIPTGLTPMRLKTLIIAAREYRANVREVPDGSNRGDGVSKYLFNPNSPAQWCCLFCSYCYHEGNGLWPFGKKEASTWSAWQYSKEHSGMFIPMGEVQKGNKIARPGDFMLIQHQKNGNWTHTGHIAVVLRTTNVVKDGFNTIGGNESNRVKLGWRSYYQSGIIGFLNPYPPDEQITNFEHGLVTKQDLAGDTTT